MSAARMAVPMAARPIIAKPKVQVFILRSGADLKAALTRSGGRGNPRAAAIARAMQSITDKILDDLDAGRPRRCGSCAEPVLEEGSDLGIALIVAPAGALTTIGLGLCERCSPDAATATRNALAAITPALPPNARISTPGQRS